MQPLFGRKIITSCTNNNNTLGCAQGFLFHAVGENPPQSDSDWGRFLLQFDNDHQRIIHREDRLDEDAVDD